MVLHPICWRTEEKEFGRYFVSWEMNYSNRLVKTAGKLRSALELFHNFTLIHDDIMDKAPLRRGKPTTHAKYNESTALLAGDVMLVKSYEYLNETDPDYSRSADPAF